MGEVLTGLENPVHLLIILLIAMLVLGPKRLPSIGRSLGSGIREFRDSIGGEKDKEISGEADKVVGGEADKVVGGEADKVVGGEADKVKAESKQ